MSTCTAKYTDSYRVSNFAKALPPMPCIKPVDDLGRHRGDHETLLPYEAPAHSSFDPPGKTYSAGVRLVHWSEGGASLRNYDPEVPSTNCMCVTTTKRGDQRELRALGHTPEDHRWSRCADCGSIVDAKQPDPVRCFTCAEWGRRVETLKDYLRPHGSDSIYSFSGKHPGGFGGARYTVVMDDGTVVAKDRAGLWFSGRLPWWVEEDFPPNCTIEPGSGSDKVPGYTDRSGHPLTFTGGPSPA